MYRCYHELQKNVIFPFSSENVALFLILGLTELYMGPGSVFSKHMWLQSLDPAEGRRPPVCGKASHSLCPGEPNLQTTAGTLPPTPPWVARASVGVRASQLMVRTSLLARTAPKLGADAAGGRVLGGYCLGALCLPKLATGLSSLASGGSSPSCYSWDPHGDLHYSLVGLSET